MTRQIPWLRVFVEGVVIVGSILLALALDTWREEQADRRTELTILGELHTALSADFEILESRLDRFRRIEVRTEVLLSHLRSGAPYADSLDAYFGTVYGSLRARLNTAGYESLKSQGLGLISDDGLRSHLTRVYERAYPSAEDSMELERMVLFDLFRPYFLVHFRDLRFGQSATPLDYDVVSSDVEFLNLLDYRIQVVRQNHLPSLETATSEIRALIEAIEAELGR